MKSRTMAVGALALALGGLVAAPVRAADLTLLVAPARHSVLQVMFDIVNRHPAALVAYQGDASEAHPALHVWNGEDWIAISRRDLAEARFLQVIPARVVLLGDETVLPPAVAEAAAWCPRIVNVAELDTPSLINACGRLFAFSPAEWQWFAARYRLQLVDQSEALRTETWYEQPTALPPRPAFPFFRRRTPAPRPRDPRTAAPPAPVVRDLEAVEFAPPPMAVIPPRPIPEMPAEEPAPVPAPDTPNVPDDDTRGIK